MDHFLGKITLNFLQKRQSLRIKASGGSFGYVALTLTSVVWGTTWAAAKVGIQGMHPLYFSAIRQTLGGLIFLLYFILTGKAVWPSPKEWRWLLMMALLLFVFSNGLTTWGIQYISSGLGSIIAAISPLVVAIIQWITGHHERPNRQALIGLVAGFAGVGIIFYEHLADFGNARFLIGIILSLVAAVSWSLATLLTAASKNGLNRYYSLGWQMFLAGIILHIVCASADISSPLQKVSLQSWQALGYMVVMGSLITFGALVYSLQHLPPTIASLYAYFNPMVAVLLGHILLKEPLSIFLLAGGIVTLIGVFIVNNAYKKAKSSLETEH